MININTIKKELGKRNAREEWLDVQVRALLQACNRIIKAANKE